MWRITKDWRWWYLCVRSQGGAGPWDPQHLEIIVPALLHCMFPDTIQPAVTVATTASTVRRVACARNITAVRRDARLSSRMQTETALPAGTPSTASAATRDLAAATLTVR